MNGRLACDAFAAEGSTLLMASVAGPASLVKAMRAALMSNSAKPEFDWVAPGDEQPSLHGLKRDKGTYQATKPVKLGYGCQHIVVWVNDPDLLLVGTEEALWQKLQATTTTPMLREWMPVIYERAVKARVFKPANRRYNCTTGFLCVKQDDLDRFVSALVKNGTVTIPRVA